MQVLEKTGFMAQVAELMDEYASALDMRRGDDWLTLFASTGYYAVLRRIEYVEGNNVLLVGEDMKRLRARMSSALERDRRSTVHMLGGIRGNEADMRCTAAFALWFDGLPVYAGRYEIQLCREEGQLRIAKCSVVLDNKVVEAPVYFPI